MGDFWNCKAGLWLRAGVRYHSLPSSPASTACDREAARKWSHEGKHLFGASRYTDHLQIAQLVPGFAWLCSATRSSVPREAAKADGTFTEPGWRWGTPGTASPRPLTPCGMGCRRCLTRDPCRKPGQPFQQAECPFPRRAGSLLPQGSPLFPSRRFLGHAALPPPHTQKIS